MKIYGAQLFEKQHCYSVYVAEQRPVDVCVRIASGGTIIEPEKEPQT